MAGNGYAHTREAAAAAASNDDDDADVADADDDDVLLRAQIIHRRVMSAPRRKRRLDKVYYTIHIERTPTPCRVVEHGRVSKRRRPI